MKTLSNLTYSLVEDCLSKNNKIEAKLLINWEKIANEYSKITFPKEIKFIKNLTNKGTLVLNVQKGFATEIQMKIPFLLNKVNNFLGYKAISEIKIKQVIFKN